MKPKKEIKSKITEYSNLQDECESALCDTHTCKNCSIIKGSIKKWGFDLLRL